METKDSYRHVIGVKEKNIVIQELKDIISNKKINLDLFSFIGIIGSHEEAYSHDIDILFFPHRDKKIGATIIEMGHLYGCLDKQVKEHHPQYYISASPKKAMQEMMYYLSSIQEGHAGIIPIHSLFFTDYKSFKKFNPGDFEESIQKDMITLYGSFDSIKELPELPQKSLEPYFFLIDFEMITRISTYPKHLVRSSAESLISYLGKKYGIEVVEKIPHDTQEIRKVVINIIHKLDEKTYS